MVEIEKVSYISVLAVKGRLAFQIMADSSAVAYRGGLGGSNLAAPEILKF
jgi:hypothetical protein